MYRHSFTKNADEVSDAIAHQIRDSMLQLMQHGLKSDDLSEFPASVRWMNGQLAVNDEICRGEAVERDYGSNVQPIKGRNIVDSFKIGDTITYKSYPIIRNAYPIKAEDKMPVVSCAHAHRKSPRRNEDPAGHKSGNKRNEKKFNLFFFMLLLIPFSETTITPAYQIPCPAIRVKK